MELLLKKNIDFLRTKKVYFSQKEKIGRAVEALNKQKILIITGVKYAGKAKFLVDMLTKTNMLGDTFYFNSDIDTLCEVQSSDDIELLLGLFERIYKTPKIIALQNCNKIPDIKELIQKLYSTKKYKIILLGNNIDIE